MRKKLAVSVGLVAAVLAVTVVVCDQVPPADPPLRVAMTGEEVFALYGHGSSGEMGDCTLTFENVDWRGNNRLIHVEFEDNRVVRSSVVCVSRTSPPWLDRALKAVGW
jgi:hypothetical protein